MQFPAPAPHITAPVSRTALPTTTHISILNGQSDFSAWHDGVKALIRHLGGYGHIASLGDPILLHRPDLRPSVPPVITPQSTQIEVADCARWWDLDNVVQHVLLARLGSSVRMILPEESFERTARDIYETLKSNFGANRRSEGTNIFLELLSVRCSPNHLRDYVTAWQNGVTKMRSCRFMVPGYVLSLLFVKNLPDSLAFGSLRSTLGARLENVVETDMEIFKEVLGNVLELDAQFKSVSSLSHSRNPSSSRPPHGPSHRPPAPPRPPSIQPAPSTGQSMDPIPTIRPTPFGTAPSSSASQHGGGTFSRRPEGRNGAPRAFLADGDDSGGPPPVDGGDPAFPSLALPIPESHTAYDILPVEPMAALSVSHIPEYIEAVDLYDGILQNPRSYMLTSPSLSDALSFLTSVSSTRVSALLDSGSTHHIIRDKSLFSNFDSAGAQSVGTANCGTLDALGSGDVAIRVPFGDRIVHLTLKDCLYAPDVPINLFSVGSLQHRRIAIRFEPGLPGGSPHTELVFPPDHPVLPGYTLLATVYRQLSFLSCDFVRPPLALPALSPVVGLAPPASSVFPRLDLTPALWHRRLGHLGLDAVRALLLSSAVSGVTHTGSFGGTRCVPCLIGKAPQQPYSHHGHRASLVGELLHMDICGPFPVATPSGCLYFYVILDDKSHHGFTATLRLRTAAFPFYKTTEALIERVSGRRIGTARMDGAKELCAGEMGKYLYIYTNRCSKSYRISRCQSQRMPAPPRTLWA
jgi:hypothetical protein